MRGGLAADAPPNSADQRDRDADVTGPDVADGRAATQRRAPAGQRSRTDADTELAIVLAAFAGTAVAAVTVLDTAEQHVLSVSVVTHLNFAGKRARSVGLLPQRLRRVVVDRHLRQGRGTARLHGQ